MYSLQETRKNIYDIVFSGDNAFTLTPQQWIKATDAIGIVSKSGRYGGTYAHTDIAFEFASWISPEFKLYVIKDCQRLKEDAASRLALGWDTKRELSKINYRIHTDAIKEGQKVVIVDDLIATGGTVKAAINLIERLGGEVVSCLFLTELAGLNGRKALEGYNVESVVVYEGK